VRTRGRRRPLRYDGAATLAAFVTSTSDIDDLVPIVTAYQIEWNKIHARLADSGAGRALSQPDATAAAARPLPDDTALAHLLGLTAAGVATLRAAFGEDWEGSLRAVAAAPADITIRLLNGSYVQYQRAAQRWWSGIEPSYLSHTEPRRPPVYFVSSNTHALVNLLGGYARAHREQIVAFARERNPEQLAQHLEQAVREGDEGRVANITYYLLRAFLHEAADDDASRLSGVQAFDAESGIRTIESPGRIDVSAQLIELSRLRADRLDPRLALPGIERLAESDAVIINIDYPLGMAAYHHLDRLAQGVGEIRGVYVMGKAATLNGRIGDVMISSVVHDEHSKNTYLFRNCFAAGDVQAMLREGTVMDNQKALTVRGAFLQNREYMGVFYREGFTVLEMEAGPYLSAVYELVNPNRHPRDEIVHLSTLTSFDVGVLHYASDTPYSRRQSLLSKSLSFFGVESTYACGVAIVQRIIRSELARLAAR
jgi:hypothetical protein